MNRDQLTAFLDWLATLPPRPLGPAEGQHPPTNQEAFAAGYEAGQKRLGDVMHAVDNARRVAVLELQCNRLREERDTARAALNTQETAA
jgi:hypothetical protein